ncbi:sigma 54-interacting transcriptional regulator [Fusobacteria bacterium ZRK30]|nr:sigma 54-interacting transcriptional regulator [Fusobacteria bacterium ZRK30]
MNDKNELKYSVFKNLVDNLYDEVIVWDENYKIVYVNKASYRHYGVSPEELIGKSFFELTKKEYWYPSVLPDVYKNPRIVSIIQKTHLGAKIKTTAVPIFSTKGKLEYVAMNVKDVVSEETSTVKDTVELENKNFITMSKEMSDLLILTEKIAKIDSTVLIQGESGTGKTFLAKHLHKKSRRNKNPFIFINCASINGNLLESELFGYVKGAFTGAMGSGKKGFIQMADKGILFLDEIGEMPLELQAKLLHVIQDREFIPVGGTKPVKIDIKIVAATNRNLKEMVNIGKFRRDLYYRLNIFELLIPPLRKRERDITPLANYFLNKNNEKYGRNCYLDEKTLKIMLGYSWPGNVRELSHIIERLVVTSENTKIKPDILPSEFFTLQDEGENDFERTDINLDEIMREYEEKIIKKYYELYPSSRKLAKELKISQSKANRLIKKYVKPQMTHES